MERPSAPVTAPAISPLAVKSKVAAAMLGVGTSTLDKLIASGRIDARRCGRSRLILVDSIRQYLNSLPDARDIVAEPPYRTQRRKAAS